VLPPIRRRSRLGRSLCRELLWIFSTWVLAGSRSILFNDAEDQPTHAVRFQQLRCSKRLRRFARLFVPLFRVNTPGAQSAEDTKG